MYSSPGSVIFHVASQARVVSVTRGNSSVSVKQNGLCILFHETVSGLKIFSWVNEKEVKNYYKTSRP